MRRALLFVPIVLLAGACSKEEAPRPPRTAEEQRAVDSTVGASALPGTDRVRGALAAQDSAAARRAQLDSMTKNP